MALNDLVRRLGGALIGAVAPQGAPPALAQLQLGAFGKLMSMLPIGDLTALIEGRATVDSELDIAERAAALIAAACPPAAITAKEVELGLQALQFLLDAAGIGPRPFKLAGGVPAAFPPGGGPGAYRGR